MYLTQQYLRKKMHLIKPLKDEATVADILQQEIDREILAKLYRTAGWIEVQRPPDGWDEDALENWCSTNLPPQSWHYYGHGCLFRTKEQAMLFQLTWT